MAPSGCAVREAAASASQVGRFETEWLTRPENLAALADLPGLWIDTVQGRRPPRIVVLDGKTPDQVVAERLKARRKLANPKPHGRAGPADIARARLIAGAAKDVSPPDR
jgi:hypothetical protein